MQTLSISEILGFYPGSPVMSYGDDFFIVDIVFLQDSPMTLAYPCRFGGLVSLYCMDGDFNLTVGMGSYDVGKDCFAVSLPGDIVSLSRKCPAGPAKIRVMAISDRMLESMEFDLTLAQVTYRNRMIRANRMYKILIHRFRDIFGIVVFRRHAETGRSMEHLLRSMDIEMAHIWADLSEAPVSTMSRNGRLTETFVALVARHHVEHRDLEFYSGKMGITPKYLSAAVKKESGRTAVDWITSYVILEAKYFLKHTRLAVKEIAYELSFANSMDFYRYFTRHAGVTPTEYRNG